ncbi:MAG: hypothetical protein IID45_04090 [Planctomycetes bacterium]|nr:hypothetical protein [Planctomycetota bacterium]
MKTGNCSAVLVLFCSAFLLANTARAQIVIPGSGRRVTGSGDNFEDRKWSFTHNFPKSSYNLDKRSREPLGVSANGLWHESGKRGQPDVVKRVETPPGGLKGSKGALLMRTLNSGIPGYGSRGSQQDDLIFNAPSVGTIPVNYAPNVIVRVYLPPFEKWDNRTDTSFGFRIAVDATTYTTKRGLFRRKRIPKTEMFYPGLFIQFNSPRDSEAKQKSAVFIVRGNANGEDFLGPKITKTGWWTLGMSLSPDGRVHYFASPGVDKLTMKDHLGSAFYRGLRIENFHTFFFDVVSRNDGKTWSTPWIIDDPYLHYGTQTANARNAQRR